MTSENNSYDSPQPKKRKTCVTCLGIAVLTIFILVLVGVWLAYKAQSSSEDLYKFVEAKVVPAFQPPNVDKLKAISTPTLSQELETSDSLRLISTFNDRLGSLKSLDKTKSNYNFNYATGTGTTGNYQVAADFEKSSGTLIIQAVRSGEDWKLTAFRINSPALLP